MADKILTIRFTDPSVSPDAFLELELDEELNDGKTEFAPGESAFIRVKRYPRDIYTMLSSAGDIVRTAVNTYQAITDEQVEFCYEKEQDLDDRPDSPVSYDWIGRDPGIIPTIDGKTIQFSSEVVAIMSVDYNYLYDRWKLHNISHDGDVIVVARMGDQKACLTVNFGGGVSEVEEYELLVKDYCTDLAVPFATVFLDDVEIGRTNTQGIINLGDLVRGSSHTVRVVKSGYIPSDEDALRNDEFTVPTAEE